MPRERAGISDDSLHDAKADRMRYRQGPTKHGGVGPDGIGIELAEGAYEPSFSASPLNQDGILHEPSQALPDLASQHERRSRPGIRP